MLFKTQEITMSLHIAKFFKNPLALAGAALVIHIGAATAADSTGDVQQQARELLTGDRKSTRLNSSHSQISYAVFCLKKKNKHASHEDILCHVEQIVCR